MDWDDPECQNAATAALCTWMGQDYGDYLEGFIPGDESVPMPVEDFDLGMQFEDYVHEGVARLIAAKVSGDELLRQLGLDPKE